MCSEYKNFDYVTLEDGIIHCIKGSVSVDGYLSGLPMYEPNTSGQRVSDYGSYSKLEKHTDWDFKANFYRESHISSTGILFPKSEIVDIRRPLTECDRLVSSLSRPMEQFYKDLTRILPDLSVAIFGSHLYNFDHKKSDIDFVVYGNSRDKLRAGFKRIQEMDSLTLIDEEYINRRSKGYSDAFGITEAEARYHLTHPPRRFWHDSTDIHISISPAQEPGVHEEYELPSPSADSTSMEFEGEIINDSAAYFMPRVYRINSGDRAIDIYTDRWFHHGSFSVGDNVRISGAYFPSVNAIFLNSMDHYLVLIDIK